MRWLIRGVVVVLGLALVVVLIGLTRPEGHVARTRAEYTSPPERVWSAVTEVERWPEWNPGVDSVERLPDQDGHAVYNVVAEWGAAPTEISIAEPSSRFRTVMDAGDFSGAWTYELSPSPSGGTLLTITEEGSVRNPLFRAMMIFHDNHATMIEYHRALGARLGESVTPEKVEAEVPGT
jgi:uncharacterized protein YndB with AHSA1/START domain